MLENATNAMIDSVSYAMKLKRVHATSVWMDIILKMERVHNAL